MVGLAFLLLTFAFRTILVPAKSILGFLLSMAAALGGLVPVPAGAGDGAACDTMSHVVSELVEEVWLMPAT